MSHGWERKIYTQRIMPFAHPHESRPSLAVSEHFGGYLPYSSIIAHALSAMMMDMQRVRIVVQHAYYPQISKGGVSPADRLYSFHTFQHSSIWQRFATLKAVHAGGALRTHDSCLHSLSANRTRKTPDSRANGHLPAHLLLWLPTRLEQQSATSTCLTAPPTVCAWDLSGKTDSR